MGVLFWSYVPLSLMYVLGSLMTAAERVQSGNKIFATAVILSLGLNALLIPHFKSMGAAWVSLIVQVFVAAALFVLNYKHFNLKPDKRLLGQLLLFCLGLWIVTHFSQYLAGFWVLKCFFVGIFALVLTILLRFWSLKSLLKLLNEQRRTIQSY